MCVFIYIFCIRLLLALINVNCCLLTQMTSWSAETWFQIRLNIRGICFAAYFHKLSDVGSSGRQQQQHTINNRFCCCASILSLAANECIHSSICICILYVCICCCLSICVHFGCARDAHVVPKNSSHVSHSQHTVPKRIVLRRCSNFLCFPSR